MSNDIKGQVFILVNFDQDYIEKVTRTFDGMKKFIKQQLSDYGGLDNEGTDNLDDIDTKDKLNSYLDQKWDRLGWKIFKKNVYD